MCCVIGTRNLGGLAARRPTIFRNACIFSSMAEQSYLIGYVAGSIPVRCTKFNNERVAELDARRNDGATAT